jgi:hypothetical protein
LITQNYRIMKKTQKEKEIIKIVLTVLDQLKFKYEKGKEFLEFMKPYYTENEELYDNTKRNLYTLPFFMEYNPDFGESQCFHASVDASTMKVISIGIAHGNLEVIYDKEGKAIKTKFISPSFPYEKQ